MVGSSIDHLGPFYQSPVPFIEFEQLPPLFATANVDLAVHRALQYGAEVAKGVLHLLQVNGLAGEILQVMHDDLLSVWYEHRDPVVF